MTIPGFSLQILILLQNIITYRMTTTEVNSNKDKGTLNYNLYEVEDLKEFLYFYRN